MEVVIYGGAGELAQVKETAAEREHLLEDNQDSVRKALFNY